jgi:hypothetical protein
VQEKNDMTLCTIECEGKILTLTLESPDLLSRKDWIKLLIGTVFGFANKENLTPEEVAEAIKNSADRGFVENTGANA